MNTTEMKMNDKNKTIKCRKCELTSEDNIPGLIFHWETGWNGHICSICSGKANEFIDKIVDKVIEMRLQRAGTKISYCRACGKKMIYLTTKNNKVIPMSLNLISHFADCPNAEEFRKKTT